MPFLRKPIAIQGKPNPKRKLAMAEHHSDFEKRKTDMGAKISEAQEQMRHAAESTYDEAAEWVDEYAGEASQFAQRQVRVMRNYFNDNPLMLGVVGLGLGLLAGAMLPITRTERRLLHPLGREMREGAGATLRRARRRLDEVAGEAEDHEVTRDSSAARDRGRHQPSRSRH